MDSTAPQCVSALQLELDHATMSMDHVTALMVGLGKYVMWNSKVSTVNILLFQPCMLFNYLKLIENLE